MRFQSDKWNQMKNLCSKVIGGKKKNKEPDGDSDVVPDSIQADLQSCTKDSLQVRLLPAPSVRYGY